MMKAFIATALTAASMLTVSSQQIRAVELDSELILGKAIFEKRSTIVPMTVCEAEPCLRPTPYWSLILIDRGVRYEINQMFAYGSPKCPNEIELSGARITQGSHVAISGRVQHLGDDYKLVNEVSRATVLPPEEVETEALEARFLPNVFGWKCTAVTPRVPLLVDILFAGADSSGERYEIHVSQVRDATKSPIASAPESTVELDDERIIFRGKSERDATLQVMIPRSEERVANLPSYLTIAKKDPGAFMVYDLRCSRTRF